MTPKPMKLNLNSNVKVELNDLGRKQLVDHLKHIPFYREQSAREASCDICWPGWRDGVIKIQLWELMEIFGPHLGMGNQIPFVDNCIEITAANQFGRQTESS